MLNKMFFMIEKRTCHYKDNAGNRSQACMDKETLLYKFNAGFKQKAEVVALYNQV